MKTINTQLHALLLTLLLSVPAWAAGEIKIDDVATGQTVYVVVINQAGQSLTTGTTFATYTTTRADFDQAMTEIGTTGRFVYDFPAVAAGNYSWVIYQDANDDATPSHTNDIALAAGSGYWSGTAFGDVVLKTLIDAVDDFLDTEIAAIKTKADFLPSATAGSANGLFIAGTNAATTVNITGNLSGSVGSVTGAVGSVTGHTPQTGDTFARIGAPAGVSVSADIAAIENQTDDIGVAGAGLTAVSGGGGGTPAQVHNQEPIEARTAKIGRRNDGVVKAYPTKRIVPGEITQLWIDCSAQLGHNIEDVTAAASSSAEITLDDSGVYGKYVSLVLDATEAEDGDTTTFTCNVVPTTGQVIKVSLDVVVDDD